MVNKGQTPDIFEEIKRRYQGVMPQEAIHAHYDKYLDIDFNARLLDLAVKVSGSEPEATVLDMGSGFGAFVFEARRRNYQAFGLDNCFYDVNYAHQRITDHFSSDKSSGNYIYGDAQLSGIKSASIDLITAWNVMEHVPDATAFLGEAQRLLKPGGWFISITPNYFAFRQEPHYFVPWLPLLPRSIAKAYLRLLGRRTYFFEDHIFYRTNWGLLSRLRRQGFRLVDLDWVRISNPEMIASSQIRNIVQNLQDWGLLPFVKLLFMARFLNPFKASVYVGAQKPQ
ncbi:MAG: SAM-dependent methyltransferase [Chloroflexi bacterium]|nr:MAG: SAM-dependent methyltransferase [Chloroflexota bacterium]MBL1193143.1 SAM-dependent methyltransferase [Chloroflexota bacterium]NOH10436.1 methyltransferase domain-containing protein [Chloroflexota bacterium]